MTDQLAAFKTVEWGPSTIPEVDLQLLSNMTGMPREACLARLASYRTEELAAAWHAVSPRTPSEIRAFYSNSDLYLWELLGWNGSPVYETYLARVQRVAQLWPPAGHRRALDFGAGVGTAALRLAELGYRVTMADLPGSVLEFARARFKERGIPVEVIEVADDVPALARDHWDVVISFDVIEHLPNPLQVSRRLVKALTADGGAAIVASFGGTDEDWPHHLHEGKAMFSGHRWDLYFQLLGVQSLGDGVYRRVGWRGQLARKVRHAFWRATGLYVQRLAR